MRLYTCQGRKNTRDDVLTKVERTRVSRINHYFIQETLENFNLSIIVVVSIITMRMTKLS